MAGISVFDIFVCVCGLGLVVWHGITLKTHFNSEEDFFLLKIVKGLVLGSALFLTFLILSFEQPVLVELIGLSFMLFSYWMYWRTMKESREAKLLLAFDEKMPHCLLQTGPYQYVRHPFYTSYIVNWLAWSFATWSLWAMVPAIAMTTLYTVAARGEEAKFARTEMAEQYEEFKKTRGRFFPKFWKLASKTPQSQPKKKAS